MVLKSVCHFPLDHEILGNGTHFFSNCMFFTIYENYLLDISVKTKRQLCLINDLSINTYKVKESEKIIKVISTYKIRN